MCFLRARLCHIIGFSGSVSSGCCNKNALDWHVLQTANTYSSQFWKLKVLDQGANRVGGCVWGVPSLVCRQLFACTLVWRSQRGL